MSKVNITKRSDNYSKWYQDIIKAADLAEHAPVRGCMVIKPYGFSIWENIQKILDKMIKDTGCKNAYFPLFIPKSFLSKEASHIKGFAKECAVVTHYRLKSSEDGDSIVVDPGSKLEEEVIVRPTSETIMYAMFAKWIKSWRDLPLLINQWANIVRWEMRTRLFLRTTEFLWQEGHTAHPTVEDADEEARMIVSSIYEKFAKEYLAIPVIKGKKSENERFPGALETYTIEAMMQDGRALQSGTSHNLGQNFAKAFDIKFTDKDGKEKYVWQTSWGVSTRLMGGLIMTHSDDNGLILPPKIAPIKVVVVPIWSNENERLNVLKDVENIKKQFCDFGLHIDDRDFETPGFKFNEWEKKGVPLRIEIGPKDIKSGQAVLVRRDTGEKRVFDKDKLYDSVLMALDEIQNNLFNRALKYVKDRTYYIDDYKEFKKVLHEKPGFIYSHWCGSKKCEEEIVEETKATIRCIPFDIQEEKGSCLKCGGKSLRRVIFAKSY